MAEKKKLNLKINREEVRQGTDTIIDKIDLQALENIKTLQETNRYREELVSSLHKLDSHSICPGSVPKCDTKVPDIGVNVQKKTQGVTEVNEVVKEPKTTVIHGSDCHCSKCCPNPTPNWFKKNKLAILLGVLWVAMIVLAIGWSPSGKTFEAIQESYVELLVDFFKMAIIAVAAIVTFKIAKDK